MPSSTRTESPATLLGSVSVPREVYEGEEYFCLFPLYTHPEAHLADKGCWQCQLDILSSQGETHAEAVRSGSNKSYGVGCINPTAGNFVAVCAGGAKRERLALISYMTEYAFVHDDIIEYAEKKSEAHLWEANHELTEGLDDGLNGAKLSTRNNIRRQIQAKMTIQLLEVDRKGAQETLRLWKEMSQVFVNIRDLDFQSLDDYLPWRAVDAGCPWCMSLFYFAADFYPTAEEHKETEALTRAAYDAWVLVNDYFSWEKEYKNYIEGGSKGQIVSCVFLFMKWYDLDPVTAKKMLREEIMAREKKFCRLKDEYLSQPGVTERVRTYIELLVQVTSGNFAWSMTTARYIEDAEDAYPGLRDEGWNKIQRLAGNFGSLSDPIVSHVEEFNGENLEGGVRLRKGDSAKSQSLLVNGDSEGPSDLLGYEEIAMEPYAYLKSLPSKGVRSAAIDALDVWYQVPETSFKIIQQVIELLHNCSLMVDDIQDHSPLRRGSPSTHTVFGVGQTINSANLALVKSLQAVSTLSSAAVSIFTNCLVDLHIGQGMDLSWSEHTKIPSTEEYFAMIDGKTGALFILMAELMRSEATINKDLDMKPLMKAMGRFFQVRDDYRNLEDADYASQKGFAEDLSGGKISLPLIAALQPEQPEQQPKTNGHPAPALIVNGKPASGPQIEPKISNRTRLMSILQQRRAGNILSPHLRQLALDGIIAAGGMSFTKDVVLALQSEIERCLVVAEEGAGVRNWILRLVVKRLEVEA